MKRCPFCAQQIQDDARICEWCHADLTQAPSAGPFTRSGQPETSGKAIASLLLGLVFFIFPAAVLAVVFGHWSRSEIRASAGRLKGAGMALTGLILGYLGVSAIPIVMIIAAIAIPNLLRAKMAANEASAVGSLRSINTACVIYSTSYGQYPPTLASLGPPEADAQASAAKADLIDSVLVAGTKSGYVFTYTPRAGGGGLNRTYMLTANPLVLGTTGQRFFFADESGVIRGENNAPANERSPPIR